MKQQLFTILTLIVIFGVSLQAMAQYRTDELGSGYLVQTINLEDDYEGEVIASIIKSDTILPSKKAILYIHGFNDYFFQTEMAEKFNNAGYNFYALDLRKCGRSYLPHQRRCDVRDISEYFAEIDSTVNVIRSEGNDTLILMAHSTGGLTASLYCDKKGDNIPFMALILNSPFFKFNLSPILRDVAIPVISFIAPLLPNINIPQGNSTVYAESLLKEFKGEWVYYKTKKLINSPDVTSGWIGAIYRGQSKVWDGLNIKIPILSMFSDKSSTPKEWCEEAMHSDIVLNVEDIAEFSEKLGCNVTLKEIEGGMHDLVCSAPNVRKIVYSEILDWLNCVLH